MTWTSHHVAAAGDDDGGGDDRGGDAYGVAFDTPSLF